MNLATQQAESADFLPELVPLDEMVMPEAGIKRALRALIVDDMPGDATLVVRSLERSGYCVQWQRVDTSSELHAALIHQIWDVVISDHLMPQLDAPTALSIVRQTGLDIPFVVVSGTVDAEIAVELMRLGAQDYLLKDDLGRLAPSIERELLAASHRLHEREAQAQADIALARYAELYDQAPVGYFTLDRTGRVMQLNRMAAHFAGAPQDQILDTAFGRFVGVADRLLFRDFLATAFASQALNICEVRLSTGVGRLHRIVRLESTGSVDGCQCRVVMIDVTASARTQRQIHHAKKQWEASVDSVPELIIITNLERVVVRCNRAAIETMEGGYLALIGRPIDTLFGDPHIATLDPTLSDDLGYEIWHQGKLLSVRCFSVNSEGGNGYVYVLQDITRRQQMADEITSLNRDLTLRTAQLEDINANLRSFCRSVSHDLRAPLRRMDAWSTAMQEDYGPRLDPRAHKYLEEIRSESQRMSQLIESMLTLSRLAHAQMQCVEVDISQLAQTIVDRQRASDGWTRVDIHIQPGMVVTGDPVLLEAMLTNLLDNACKFSSLQPQPRVDVGYEDRGAVRIYYVRDNGVGFDSTYADKLFTPFQRLHKEAEFPGTGVGLATVHQIVARHGGRIWAESELGRGTTLYFQMGAVKST